MASVIYKLINGELESKRCDIAHLEQELKFGGWSTDPSGQTKEETVEVLDVDGDGEISKDEADTNETGKLSVKEIRAAAEEAGIEDFASARIATLKAKLWPTQK